MPERQIINLPAGPQAGPGIASLMPGADTKQARPVVYNPIQLQKQAPGMLKQPGGVLSDAGALTAGDIGESHAIAQVGDAASRALVSIGDRIDTAYESSLLVKAEAEMKMAHGAFMANLPQNPDSWQEQWNSASRDIRDKILGDESKLTPALKQKLQLNFTAFDATARNDLDSKVRAHKISLSNQMDATSMEYYKSIGDMDGLAGVLAKRVGNGQMLPQAANFELKMAVRQKEFRDNWNDSYSQPFLADEALKAGHFDDMLPEDKLRLQKMVEQRKEEVQRDEFGAALNMTLKNRELPHDVWLNNVQTFAPHLDEKDLESLNRHRLGTMETDAKTFNEFAERARSFTDKSTSWEYAKFERDVGNNIEQGMQNDILGIAKASINAGQDAFSFKTKNGLDLVKKSVDRKFGYSMGLFGTIPPDKVEKEKELQRRQVEFLNYMRTHPDASDTDVEKFIDPEGFLKVKMNEQRMQTDPIKNAMFYKAPITPRYQEILAKQADAWQNSVP